MNEQYLNEIGPLDRNHKLQYVLRINFIHIYPDFFFLTIQRIIQSKSYFLKLCYSSFCARMQQLINMQIQCHGMNMNEI